MKIKELLDLPFKYHLGIGAIIRLILIIYSDFHDRTYDVPYTDIDYKVFTDAARHVVRGNSPFLRHTYRYSPIVAYLMVPNIVVNKHFGKVLFSVFDILITIAVKSLVEKHLVKKSNAAIYCSLFWLYNPLSIGISTRGNADSVPCFFIILSLLFLQADVVKGLSKFALSAFLLGVSIHLRLYPLAFSFPMYLSLGDYKINRNTTYKEGFLQLLIPNKKQIILAASCIFTLFVFTYGFYLWYGYEFLFETYIYHLFRKDTRHNFSVLFYYSYLTMDELVFDIVKTICQLFELVLLFVISLSFGCDPETLPFAMFCQAVVLVAYNSVITSQYFIWFLSLLPLVVHNIKIMKSVSIILAGLWILAQCGWLFYAYLLEFTSSNKFILIWLNGIIFFCTNIYILVQLISNYCPGHNFGLDSINNNKIKSK